MLYYFFHWLDIEFDVPGAAVFEYISFRASMSAVLSLFVVMVFGKYFIKLLKRMQIDEEIRDLGLTGQSEKKGTPTMGGLIILSGILLPTLLFAKVDNFYIYLILLTTIWMGAFGFLDDYIKVFKGKKEGLKGKFKIMGQISIGLIVGGAMLYYNNSTITTIPFLKGNEFDYSAIVKFIGENYKNYTFIVFIPVIIFIVTAVSNGLNITDGLDGLAAGIAAIIGTAIGVLAYLSGNVLYSKYLNIMYLQGAGELAIYCSAFVGACIGFLWYNSFPAQVFMGDTGSLALGAAIAVSCVIIRKELLIPVLCGILLAENASVIIQVSYFKYTKMKYGEGKRIFKMSPLHHHYQKSGFHEAKIVTRFWIAGLLLAIFTIVTLKIR